MQPDNLIRPNAFVSTLHTQYFATVGKALHVAQHFEKTCKCLVNIIDLKQSVIAGSISIDEGGLSTFCDKIQKRMLGSAIRDFEQLASIPPDLLSVLKKANTSRNNIAHDSTCTAIDPFSPEESLWESLEGLSEDVNNICTAAEAVCSIIHSVTEQEALHLRKHYTTGVMLWVFSDFKNEDFMSKWGKTEG
jgi:hypothetical protein